ncbi:MAG: MBL fold metallo-hydrolase [Deltaproteobacteria bacterium]|nr:MBL fold metallo-hydrolase [Deltaproteobacteria bacterium]MBW2415487.1 MBL fold metallo-hydrolase [Deltaproteobacteria bacterium]
MSIRRLLTAAAALATVVVIAAALGLDIDVRIATANAGDGPEEWSPTAPFPQREVYYPGTEALADDEMRVTACGTGMPQPRLKQAAACFLVELGNGDKFIFDMGAGSAERLAALGIPLDQLNRVFLGHLHIDHAGDFPAFYFTGPVNNRLTPMRVWGPSGVRPEWGTKVWVEKMLEMWAWEKAGRGSAVDPRGLELEVNEFDWTAVNAVIYQENGVTIRTLPAIHLDQSVSFVLEWKGLRFAFSSDTLPNKWWRAYTNDVDLAIHECFIPPDYMMARYGMTPSEAVYVGTQGHTAAQAFGKIMSLTKPRHAVCYHFQNDFDTAPAVLSEIRKTYDGPLDLAQDFMVWNVTKKHIRTRMGVPNHESYPAPPQRVKYPPDSMKAYKWTQFSLSGVEPESAAVTNKLIEEFNKRNGTDIKPGITGLPFRDEQ